MNFKNQAVRWVTSLTVASLIQPIAGQAHDRDRPAPGPLPLECTDFILQAPISLKKDIGIAHENVTTSSARAQAYYDQGLSFLYSYDWIHAGRSFHEALRLDPNLAMAYLGLSYVYSAFAVNNPAKEMADKAKKLAAAVTLAERLRIDLRLEQLKAMHEPGVSSGSFVNDLDNALKNDPLNINLLLERGVASEGFASAVGQRGGPESIRYYQQVLTIDPDNAAAHHFLIHSNEMIGNISEAIHHAAAYQRLAPAVAHAHHMYGHDLRRTERVKEAIAQFEKANELAENDYRAEPETLLYDWNYRHNMNLLGATYAQAGMLDAATRTLKKLEDMRSITPADDLYRAQYPTFLLREDQENEAIKAAAALAESRFETGRVLGHALSGSALARHGEVKMAQEELQLAEDEFLKLPPEWASQVGPRIQILRAQIELVEGKRQTAISRFKTLILQMRSMPGSDAWSDYVLYLQFVADLSVDAGEWDLARFIATDLEAKAPFYRGTHRLLSLIAQHDGNSFVASHEQELSRKFTLQ